MLKIALKQHLHQGTVIPAHPLALDANRQLDEAMQRQLTRYYIASGAGGIAVGVHSTQFEIREPQHNLFEKVLALAAEEVEKAQLERPFIKVAGICGPTNQALAEAETALSLGYDMGLLSMGGLQGWTEAQILDRVRAVAAIIPVFGSGQSGCSYYPGVRILPSTFCWWPYFQLWFLGAICRNRKRDGHQMRFI